MCKAMDIWLAERESKGVSQGLSQGLSQGNEEMSYKMLMKVLVSRFGKKAGELAAPAVKLSPEHHDPRNRQNRTDKFSPLKRRFLDTEETKYLRHIGDQDLGHNDEQCRLRRTQAVHTFDHGPGDKCAHDTAKQHVLPVDGKHPPDFPASGNEI